MALTIKTTPVLEGQAAIDFIMLADKNATLNTPSLSEEETVKLHRALEKSRNFKFE